MVIIRRQAEDQAPAAEESLRKSVIRQQLAEAVGDILHGKDAVLADGQGRQLGVRDGGKLVRGGAVVRTDALPGEEIVEAPERLLRAVRDVDVILRQKPAHLPAGKRAFLPCGIELRNEAAAENAAGEQAAERRAVDKVHGARADLRLLRQRALRAVPDLPHGAHSRARSASMTEATLPSALGAASRKS